MTYPEKIIERNKEQQWTVPIHRLITQTCQCILFYKRSTINFFPIFTKTNTHSQKYSPCNISTFNVFPLLFNYYEILMFLQTKNKIKQIKREFVDDTKFTTTNNNTTQKKRKGDFWLFWYPFQL